MSEIREAFDNNSVLVPKLRELLDHPNWKAKVAALTIIYERGWGKAPQPVAVTGQDGVTLNANALSEAEFKSLGDLLSKLVSSDGNRPSSVPDPRKPGSNT